MEIWVRSPAQHQAKNDGDIDLGGGWMIRVQGPWLHSEFEARDISGPLSQRQTDKWTETEAESRLAHTHTPNLLI